MSDQWKEIKDARGRLERIWSRFPGVQGYREKETRREIDRRIREEIETVLEAIRHRVTDLQRDLLRIPGGIRWMNDLERIQSKLTLFADKVRTAAYGYRPLFDIEKIKEEELERLIRFDTDILKRLPDVEDRLRAAQEAASQSAEAFGAALKALDDAIEDLYELYTQREQAVQRREDIHPNTDRATKHPETFDPSTE